MRTCIACLLICAAFSGCANAQSPVEIADGRQPESWLDLSAWLTRPPIQQASTAARAYWLGQDPNYEEDVRILAIADGAFTQPGSEQQAVLFVMSLWPRCCPKSGLAIVEGDRLVRNVAFEGIAQELSAAPDLDGDGHDELFSIGSFGMGGQETRTLTYLRFGAEGLVEQGSTSIFDSTCAASEEGQSTAARVLARPGPTFMVEQYTLATCGEETWEPVNGPEPLEFYAPSGSPYVDLPVQAMGH